MKLSLSIVAITLFQVINSAGLGSKCEDRSDCPSGTSCLDYKDNGKTCIKLVGAGQDCNRKSQKCKTDLRCSQDNICYQGKDNDKQKCDDDSNCTNDEVCTRTAWHPGVRYCWTIETQKENGVCGGRKKCGAGLECKPNQGSAGWIVNLLRSKTCQKSGPYVVPEDSPIR